MRRLTLRSVNSSYSLLERASTMFFRLQALTNDETGLSYKKLKVFNAIIKLSKLSAKSSNCSFLF